MFGIEFKDFLGHYDYVVCIALHQLASSPYIKYYNYLVNWRKIILYSIIKIVQESAKIANMAAIIVI